MQATLPSAQCWGGRLAGPSPAGPSPGPRPEFGPGPPAQSSPRVSPSTPEHSPSGHTPRGRDTRDGHPLPAPVVTYVGDRCRRGAAGRGAEPRPTTDGSAGPARRRGWPPFRCRKGEYLPEKWAFIPLCRSRGGRGGEGGR